MKRVLVSLAILASLGLTACANMGDGYGYHHDGDRRDSGDRHDGGDGDHRGDDSDRGPH